MCVVDNDEVMEIASDSSFCAKKVRWRTETFASGAMRDVHQLWDVGGSLEPVAKKSRVEVKGLDIGALLQMNRELLEIHGHATACA